MYYHQKKLHNQHIWQYLLLQITKAIKAIKSNILKHFYESGKAKKTLRRFITKDLPDFDSSSNFDSHSSFGYIDNEQNIFYNIYKILF